MEDKETSEEVKKDTSKKAISLAPLLERCGAFVFDFGFVCLLLNIVIFGLSKTVESSFLSSILNVGQMNLGSTQLASYIGGVLIWFLIIILFSWPYFAFFESSEKRATLGKKLAGLYVGDLHLQSISFKTASIRHFAKAISFSVFGFGFLAALASEQKQALHDSIVKTLVLREKSHSENQLMILFVSGLLMLSISAFFMKLSHGSVKKPVVVFNDIESKFKKRDSSVGGFLKIGDEEIVMKDIVAVYDSFRERFRFYFFDEVLSDADEAKLKRKISVGFINSLSPFFSVELGAKRGSEVCDKDTLRYQRYERKGKKLKFSAESEKKLIKSFHCRILQESKISAHFVKSLQNEEDPEVWDIQFNTELFISNEKESITFDSKNSKDIFAFKNISDEGFDTVQIGFFEEELDDESKQLITDSKSFFVEGVQKPQAYASFDLAPDSEQFDLESIVKYGIVIFRDEAQGIEFPGEEDSISIYEIPNEQNASFLTEISGDLNDLSEIYGTMSRKMKYFIGTTELELNWRIDLDSLLNDFTIEPEEKEEEQEQGDFCRITSDGVELKLDHPVALYYPSEKDIAIGFYFEPLEDSEKMKVRKNRLIWNYVNDKRPNFVVFLDFKRDSEELSIDNLISYSVFLLRDRHGRLYFPGSHDRIQFKRIDVEIEKGEIGKLIGVFQDGEKLWLRMKSKRTSKRTNLEYFWNLNTEVELMDVSR